MIFGAPWLALGLLAALGPALLVLWILRMRRARLRVPAQWLWDESREDLRAQVPFQRLRWSVLLLLQAIALALLLLAAAQPRVATSDGRGGRTVLLVDASASMQTRDGMQGGTRFDDAIEAARAAVDRLHPAGLLGNTGGQTMLVTLEGEARIVQPFTGSRMLLHRALDDLRATDASARFEQAAMLSSAWAAVPDPDAAPDSPPPPPARLELFTDGGLADLATVAAGLDNLRVHSTGTAGTSNSAVARVGGQRSHDDSARIEPWASLLHFGADPVTVTVRFNADGVGRSVVDVQLPAAGDDGPGRADVLFPAFAAVDAVLLQATIVPGDALPVDDTAHAIVPAAVGSRVLLAGEPDQALERALRAMGCALGAEGAADLFVAALVKPVDLPDVPSLTFGVPPNSAFVRASSSALPGRVMHADPRHQVSRGSRLAGVEADQLVPLAVDPSVRVLAEAAVGPVAVAWRERGVPRVHVSWLPSRSTWPMTEDFITFLIDARAWLVGQVDEARGPVAGERLEVVLPASAANVQVLHDGAVTASLQPADPSRTVWGPVQHAGVHTLAWQADGAGSERRVVVGVPVRAEGDVGKGAEALETAGIRSTPASPRSMALWPFAVAAALLTLAIEWWIWTRRQ